MVNNSNWASLPRVAALLCLIAGNSLALGAPVAHLSASVSSGPAPLPVFFDATASFDTRSGVDPFRELGYRFHFGNPGAGTWQYSGLSRDEQIGGPLAAHVFTDPGTYLVRLTVRDGAGLESTVTTEIVVESADAAFSGARTVCISRTADFNGCPVGADRVQNATSWPSFRSDTRYLLRRGQDFTSLGQISFGINGRGLRNAHLGAFGEGARPRVGNVVVESGPNPATEWHDRIVVSNLDAYKITQYRGGENLLLFRNSLVRGGEIEFAAAFGYYLEISPHLQWRNPTNIFIVDNEIVRSVTADGNLGISGNGTRIAIMGNLIDQTPQHNIRLWQAHKLVIAHNHLTGRAREHIRHTIKLHSAGTEPAATTLLGGVRQRQRTSQVVVANNVLGSESSNINWITQFSPQNAESAEGLEDVVVEDNRFRYGTNHYLDLNFRGRRMTERGNRNETSNGPISTNTLHNISLQPGWDGPYYFGEPSMRGRFSIAATARPSHPTSLVVD